MCGSQVREVTTRLFVLVLLVAAQRFTRTVLHHRLMVNASLGAGSSSDRCSGGRATTRRRRRASVSSDDDDDEDEDTSKREEVTRYSTYYLGCIST